MPVVNRKQTIYLTQNLILQKEEPNTYMFGHKIYFYTLFIFTMYAIAF